MNNKQNLLRNIIAALLAVLLFAGISLAALPEEVQAADNTLVTDSIITKRIDELNKKLGKTYWNTDHSRNTCGTKSKGHGGECCRNANVIESGWFKDLFGFKSLSWKQFPETSTTRNAKSCAGFAAFAEWYIFRTNDSATVKCKKIGSFKSSGSNWDKAKPGDVVRWGGHSFIFLKNDKKNSRIYVLDCNYSGKEANGKTKANNCMVQKHYMSYKYSGEKFVLWRESTRASCKHTSGYQTEWNGSEYVTTVCKKCGVAFDYKSKVEDYTADATTTSKKPILHEDPYEDSPQVYCFVSGVKVKVTGKVKNAYGNTWYQVTYTEAGKEKKGFMYESSLLFYNTKP